MPLGVATSVPRVNCYCLADDGQVNKFRLVNKFLIKSATFGYLHEA